MLKPSLLLALLSLGGIVQGADHAAKNSEEMHCPPGPSPVRAAVRHIEAGGIGYNKGYTTMEAFVASSPDRWCVMPFLDARGHIFNDGKTAVNAGLGARSIWGCRVYGINAYYDYRKTHRKRYNQIGLGLETLGTLWDVRINGYLPVGDKVTGPYDPTFGGFREHSILVKRKFQYAMKGIDAEAGFHFGKRADFDFYGAAGPYWFKGPMGKGAIGGKARLAGYYKEYVTVELSDSFDSVFHNNFQGQLTLTLPLGPKSKPKRTTSNCPDTCGFAGDLSARMLQPVNRQEIIVIDTHTKKKAADTFVVFVNNLSSSLGTYESPYPDLNSAQTNSQPGDLIYVFSGNGAALTGGIVLQDNQKFWGSGSGHNLTTNLGTIYIPPQTPQMPQITNGAGASITLAQNNDISGFVISGSSGSNIDGSSPGNVSVTNCTISDTAGVSDYGIELVFDGTNGSVLCNNVTFLSNANDAMNLRALGSAQVDLMLSNCFFAQNSNPLVITTANTSTLNATVVGNTFLNNTDSISITTSNTSSLDLNFDNNFITGSGSTWAMQISAGAQTNCSVTLKNNLLDTNPFGGVFINASTVHDLTFVCMNNRFINSQGNALLVYRQAGFTYGTMHNNFFSGNTGSGFTLFHTNSAASSCYDIRGNFGVNNNSGPEFHDYVFDNQYAPTSVFRISPCNWTDLNVGNIQYVNTIADFTFVESCPSGAACP